MTTRQALQKIPTGNLHLENENKHSHEKDRNY
jgi:hypothetical protein